MSNKIYVGFALALFTGVASCNGAYQYGTKDNTVITVTDKERIIESDGDGGATSKYLVFGETLDGETVVFQNTDAWLSGKFNSSTIQGRLKEGEEYNITTYGWRSGLLSMYPNIVDVSPIKP